MKHIVFILLLISIFSFGCYSYLRQIPYSFAADVSKPTLNLVFVHSYSENFTCTAPQKAGLDLELRKISKYKIISKEFYMKSKTKNVTPIERDLIADKIYEKIKIIKPEYVFMTDDPAFRHLGVRLANEGYKVLVSGLNRTLSSYKEEFKDLKVENIVAVNETIRLDPIFQIFDQSKFFPKTWYILYDDDLVSYYMLKDYRNELAGKGNIVEQKVTNIQELRAFLKSTQDKNSQSVYFLALQSIKDPDKGKFVSKEEFFDEFVFYNKYNLEIGGNPDFVNIGIGLCCGPDFRLMGEKLGMYFINTILDKPFKEAEMTAITTTFANTKRLSELNLLYLANNGIKIIKEVNDSY